MTQLAARLLALACVLATPLPARADPTLGSIDVRCGDGPAATCALQLEFTRPIHLGQYRFAIRQGPSGDFTAVRGLAPDPEHASTVYLRLPEPEQPGEYRVRWSLRADDGRVLRSGERTVRVRGARG